MSDEEIQEIKKGKWAGVFDRFMDSWDVVVAKMTSGKFLAVTFDTIGYFCGVVICGYLTIKKIVDESVFIAVLGSYGLLVQKTREAYFNIKGDKKDEKTDVVVSGDVNGNVTAASKSGVN